jgi:hypothetical protein
MAPTRQRLDAAAGPTRFAGAWAALVYALSALALAYPALAGGFLVSPISDQFIGGFPVRDFAAMSLKSGHGIPLWNPYLFGGLPYVAAMHGDIFYPTFLLRMLLPTDVAMTWSFIIHLFLAGCFTYVFLRAWGLGFFPALLGGLAYMLGGPIASYAAPGHDGKLYVSALLPLGLWTLMKGIRDGRQWAWGLLALVVGLAVLSPHPQLLQYMLLTCGGFALYLAFASIEQADGSLAKLERRVAVQRLGLAFGAVLLGALIGAVQYFPVREYVPFSPRAGGRDYAYATTYSLPLEELFNMYLPQFTGILDQYWGRNGIHFHSEYLGAGALMLAGAGLRSERRGFRWFWIGALIVSVLWALGGSTPFYRLIYALVPGSKFFRAPSTILYVVAFSVAVLAALGTERLLAARVSVRYAVGWTIFGLVVALLASVGALTNVAQVIASSYAADQLVDRVDANTGPLIAGAWRSFFVVALMAGLIFGMDRGRLTARLGAWLLALLVAVDLYSISKQYWIFSPPAAVLYRSDAAIDYIKAQPQPGRTIALRLGQRVARDPMFDGDGLMVHGVRLVLGYHGNELGRYQLLAGKSQDRDYDLRLILSPMFLRHENVRYLYTDVDEATLQQMFASLKLGAFVKVAGPAQNAAGTTVYLYRIPGDNPVAWLAPGFFKATDQQSLATVLDSTFDPTRVAILDTSSKIVAPQITSLPAPLGISVGATNYRPGDISLQLAAPAPAGAALIVSENYFPGWKGTVDGKVAPLDRAQYNLIGVQLPAGARSVNLHFDDPAYETGKTVTIVAIVLSLALAGLGLVRLRQVPTREGAVEVRNG